MQKDNLKQIAININRLRAQKAALELKTKKKDNQQRKMRTRTLIQLGGLLAVLSCFQDDLDKAHISTKLVQRNIY